MGMKSVAAAAVTATLFVCVATAHAEVSFKGKTVNIIINSKAGGGTDASARLVGQTLGTHLPGKPQILFRNMPGGGGIKAQNYFASGKVKPDGLTLLSGSRSQLSPLKLLMEQSKYDPSKLEFIGGDAYLGTVIVIRKDARQRLQDPKAKPVLYGDVDGNRSGITLSLFARKYLGWNIRHVVGYSGSPAVTLAARSGELQMMDSYNEFVIKPLIDSGEFEAVAQVGLRDENGNWNRRRSFPDIPALIPMLKEKLDPKAATALEQAVSDMLVSKWLALPEGTPQDIVDIYRAAYKKTVADEAVLKVFRNEIGADYEALTGKQIKDVVNVLVKVTKDDLAYVNKMKADAGLPVD